VGFARWLNEKLFGIDCRRKPPRFAGKSLDRRLHEVGLEPITSRFSNAAFFFPDTFASYHEPEVGLAAMKLLNRTGAVIAPGTRGRFGTPGFVCCGRPLISNGMLDEAIRHAEHNVERLHLVASTGVRIVACEPSCILTIKDDYPACSGESYTARRKPWLRRVLPLRSISNPTGRVGLLRSFGPGQAKSSSRATVISAPLSAWPRR